MRSKSLSFYIVIVAAAILGALCAFLVVPPARAADFKPLPSAPGLQPAPKVQQSDSGRESDYCQRNLGKWFYCQSPEPEPEPETKDKPSSAPSRPQSQDEADYEALKKFKEDMEKARLIAVWNPSAENLKRYQQYQKAALDKGGLFADSWRRMVWEDPSNDYSLMRPVSELGKSTWTDTRNLDRDMFFRSLKGQIGIYYIYRGNCAPCKVQSPTMANFVTRYGVTVHAISADGSPNEFFPNAKKDSGQLKAWGFSNSVSPAFLVYQAPNIDRSGAVHPLQIKVSDDRIISLRPCTNPKGCLQYIGAGVLSVDELAERLYVVLGTEPGKDF